MKRLIIIALSVLGFVGLGLGPAAAADGVTAYQGDDYAVGWYHHVSVKDVECDGNPVRVEFTTSDRPGFLRFERAYGGCDANASVYWVPDDEWICYIQVQEQRPDGLWIAGTGKNVADRC